MSNFFNIKLNKNKISNDININKLLIIPKSDFYNIKLTHKSISNEINPNQINLTTTTNNNITKKSNKSNKKRKLNNDQFQKPCFYYLEGRCKKGNNCEFSHDIKPIIKTELCKYWLNGSCIKGEQCVYSHEKSKYPCKYYHLNNNCKYGDNCRYFFLFLFSYSHDKIDNEMLEHLKEVYKE